MPNAMELVGAASPEDVLALLAMMSGGGGPFRAKAKQVSVERGDVPKIILPKDMEVEDAITWLKRKLDEENTKMAIREDVECYPLDGANALRLTIQEIYGFNAMVATKTFFGPKPPAMISVQSGPDSTIQVPWGRMEIPNIDGFLTTSIVEKDGRPIFSIQGEVKRKHEKRVHDLAEAVRRNIREQSLYKGKAIQITFRDPNTHEVQVEFDPTQGPKFMDLSKVNPAELVFSETTMKTVQITLFNPIEQTEKFRRRGTPLKRGALLYGPYGTGKTLCALVAAKKCVEHGWTYISLDDVRDLPKALYFAQLYAPAVVFAEDVDRAVGLERDSDVDRYLNTLDGVNSKSQETILVVTSNNAGGIAKAFMRPGRIDTAIRVCPPDSEARVRLAKYVYGRGGLDHVPDADLKSILDQLDGENAAVIREVVERAKSANLDNDQIAGEDLAWSVASMQDHLVLMKEPEAVEPDPMRQFGESVAEVVGDQIIRAHGGKRIAAGANGSY